MYGGGNNNNNNNMKTNHTTNNNSRSRNKKPISLILIPHNDMTLVANMVSNRNVNYELPHIRLKCTTSSKIASVCRHMADKLGVDRNDVHLFNKFNQIVNPNRSIGPLLPFLYKADQMTFVAHYIYVPTSNFA